MRRKIAATVLSLIVISIGIYLYVDRSFLALQTGTVLPLQWDEPYSKKEEPIRLTPRGQSLSKPHVSLTPLYYLPKSKKLQFGLWYSKHKYRPDPSLKIPDRIFQVTVRGKNDQPFDHDIVIKTTGVWDEFQQRSIAADLSHQDSIEITLSLIEQDGTAITPIESSSFEVQLKP